MREKNGFTLIELLAVIVILAVIALIATPLIMGVIDDARKGSAKNGAYGYVKAMENTIATEMIKDTTISPSPIQTTVGQVVFTKRTNNGNMEDVGTRGINYKGTKPSRHNLNIINGTQKMEFQMSKQSTLNLRQVVKIKRMERKMENG